MAISANQQLLIDKALRALGHAPGEANIDAAMRTLATILNSERDPRQPAIRYPDTGYTNDFGASIVRAVDDFKKKTELVKLGNSDPVPINVYAALKGEFPGAAEKLKEKDFPAPLKDIKTFVALIDDAPATVEALRAFYKDKRPAADVEATAPPKMSVKIDLKAKPEFSTNVPIMTVPNTPAQSTAKPTVGADGSLRLHASQYKTFNSFAAPDSGVIATLSPGVPKVTTSTTFRLQDAAVVAQKTDSGPAEESYVYEMQKPGEFTDNPHVRHAQELALQLNSKLEGKLKIDLGLTGDNKDGVDGKFGEKTKAAVIAMQRYFATPEELEKGEFDGRLTSELVQKMEAKLAQLEQDVTVGPQAGADAAVKAPTAAPTAPAAPVIDPAVLAAASQTAEQSLKKIAEELGKLEMHISAPGPADGDFDAQSVKSGEEALKLLVPLLGMQNPSGKYSLALGAQMKAAINGNDTMKQTVEKSLGVGGFDKMIDAFDTLNKAGKFGVAPAPAAATAPAAPQVDPAVLAAATQTAEKGLGIFQGLLKLAGHKVSKPGQAGGEFDAQSIKSLNDTLVAMGFTSGAYTPEIGAQLKEKLKTHEHKDTIQTSLAPIGGADKLVEALDTLHAAGKLDPNSLTNQFRGAAQRFPFPAITQQQGNLLAWMVGRDEKTSMFTNELMRLYGGYGIEDIDPAQVPLLPGLKRAEGAPELPPVHEHSKRVSQVFKEMLDSGMSLEDIQRNLIQQVTPPFNYGGQFRPATYGGSLEALVQVSGDAPRAQAFRIALLNSFSAADQTINLGESNENIAKAFENALHQNWTPANLKYSKTFQQTHIMPGREPFIAPSAQEAFPGMAAKRNGTGEPMGFVDLFEEKNKGQLFGTRDPVLVKGENGDVKVISLDPKTNLLSVETISAKELAAMQEILDKAPHTEIRGVVTDAGKTTIRNEWGAVHGALTERSAAYRVIMENHGFAVLNNDPAVFMQKLTNAKTVDELRTELNGHGTAPVADAKNGTATEFDKVAKGQVAVPPEQLSQPDAPGRKPGQAFGPQQQ